MKFVFWWDSPCKGMIGVLREFCKLAPDTVVLTGGTGKRREAMGWEPQKALFPQHKIIVAPTAKAWESLLHNELQNYLDDFHIVNGLVRPIFRPLLAEILQRRLPYATMTEAPCNMMNGTKKIVKSILGRVIQPIRHRKFAKTAQAFISLSGGKAEDLNNIERLGFPRERIFPFGYFTDQDDSFTYEPVDDGKLHLLCPGLLEPYKGVDLLVEAIGILPKNDLNKIVCHITGNGSEKKRLDARIMVCAQ